MSAPSVWRETFKVHSYEVGANGRATVDSLCRYFQEAAWNHAEALGLGYTQLLKQNRLWVLSRLALRISEYPRWGATLELTTWPRPTRSVFALRDFEATDSDGNRLFAGSTAWLVLDAQTRKAQRVDKLLAGMPDLLERSVLEADPEKIPPIADLSTSNSNKVQVRWSDLDINEHVNYSRYIGWILDVHPTPFHQSFAVCELAMNYLDETGPNESATVGWSGLGSDEYAYSIVKHTGPEVCRGRARWTAIHPPAGS